MRKIIVHMSVSLDGFFEGPDHDISWHRVDDELHTYVNEQLATASTFLEGRVTQELMAAFWPTADQDPEVSAPMKEFAGIWRDMPKIVFSRTLDRVDWATEVRNEVDPAEIRALKDRPGGDMVLGGADLAATFRRHDLIDEYRLFVNPVLLGRGRQLFGPSGAPTDLRLVEARTFGNGVVLLRHERAR
ncbi:dihydrofolate reductase [Blastococcus colisei]|uniref:Dihydrofolate reductase n=1 Tax=Blastococcus colisei TaxID=1564162 RepID=A0A543PBK8_9ACTN|nr:dihydrofolate reductase family protein [Blastococcus colisei]TQN41466.1 dihydrofolate reductase [Blastococcus colisei]